MASEQRRNIVVVGGSAGGIRAVMELLSALPADFPAAVFVVLHVAPHGPSALPELLGRAARLKVRAARHGAPIVPGEVVISRPDYHLILEETTVRLSHGPRENAHRPSIDVLFRSAAVAHGPRTIGVAVSGTLDDGSAGLWAIKRRGGVALVQDPAEADYPELPRNAMKTAGVDDVLRVAALADRLTKLVTQPIPATTEPSPPSMADEVRMASDEPSEPARLDALGSRTSLTCPECGGTMWQLDDAAAPRYRCHVGHAYSLLALATDQSMRVEAALWAALRALE
jgi:two-component system chemotaxis response regulator CheB